MNPPRLHHAGPFRFEALGPEHNERDHLAWMTSIAHIGATPGFGTGPEGNGGSWPYEMSLADNLADLVGHRREFDDGEAFAYSILVGDEVMGCVYVDPDRTGQTEAAVRSWVSAPWARFDARVAEAIARWLWTWPLASFRYVGRQPLSRLG